MTGSNTILILGGAGMVGLQVARQAVRELAPKTIVISALTQREVDDAVGQLSKETSDVTFVPAAADLFVPQSLQGRSRAEIVTDRAGFDVLFDEIFSSDPTTYRRSALFALIQRHQPDVIVDCINTATAISYQDEFKVS